MWWGEWRNLPRGRVWSFLKSGFGLFLLSSVLLGSLSFLHTTWSKAAERRRQAEQLYLEVTLRINDMQALAAGPERHPAPDAAMQREIEVSVRELADVGAVAYRLVEKIYTWFGLQADEIPYTACSGDRRVVDPASFSKRK